MLLVVEAHGRDVCAWLHWVDWGEAAVRWRWRGLLVAVLVGSVRDLVGTGNCALSGVRSRRSLRRWSRLIRLVLASSGSRVLRLGLVFFIWLRRLGRCLGSWLGSLRRLVLLLLLRLWLVLAHARNRVIGRSRVRLGTILTRDRGIIRRVGLVPIESIVVLILVLAHASGVANTIRALAHSIHIMPFARGLLKGMLTAGRAVGTLMRPVGTLVAVYALGKPR